MANYAQGFEAGSADYSPENMVLSDDKCPHGTSIVNRNAMCRRANLCSPSKRASHHQVHAVLQLRRAIVIVVRQGEPRGVTNLPSFEGRVTFSWVSACFRLDALKLNSSCWISSATLGRFSLEGLDMLGG